MAKYASRTSVSRNQSRDQIEVLLRRRGAEFINMNDTNPQNVLLVHWMRIGVPYKFELQLPAPDDPEITHSSKGKPRTEKQVEERQNQVIRQFWRIAHQYLYMLHEMMEATGMEFREAFAPLIMLKSKMSVWQAAVVAGDEALSKGMGLEALMPPETGKK